MLADRAKEAAGSVYSSIYSVPQGLIFLLNTTSIPDGYRRFDELDNRHPVGAGSTYSPKDTGGAQASISRSSSTKSGHSGDAATFVGPTSGGSNVNYGKGYATAGAHEHSITAKYDRSYQSLIFLKATAPHANFPADAIILGKAETSPIAGLSACYEDNYILRGSSAIASGGGLINKACSSDGWHTHSVDNTRSSGSDSVYVSNYSGGHSHGVTMAVSDEELKRAYLTAWTKASEFAAEAGIIAMWEGVTPPPKWHLCDGTDGTLDLRDYFIILSSGGNAGTNYDQSNRIYITASLDSITNNHSHQGGSISTSGTWATAHYSMDNTHSHSSTSAWQDYVPPYYALTFVERQ